MPLHIPAMFHDVPSRIEGVIHEHEMFVTFIIICTLCAKWWHSSMCLVHWLNNVVVFHNCHCYLHTGPWEVLEGLEETSHWPTCSIHVLWEEGTGKAFFAMRRRLGSITQRGSHGERIGLVQQGCHAKCPVVHWYIRILWDLLRRSPFQIPQCTNVWSSIIFCHVTYPPGAQQWGCLSWWQIQP